jgi:predicted O-methyltransferase YrrM
MTPEPRWTAVDDYVNGRIVAGDAAFDAALEAALTAATRAGLPAINVSPPQGKLLHLLARAIGARRVLEVGTLAGYSTLWLARALPPEGEVVTLEIDATHAHVAQANFAAAGLAARIDLRLGAALDSLAELERARSAQSAPFDFVFIDADKPNNANYYELALRLARRGGLIVVDNVVRNGAVADAASADASVLGTRALIDRMTGDARVSATAIQTVGSKGYDGFVLAVVN